MKEILVALKCKSSGLLLRSAVMISLLTFCSRDRSAVISMAGNEPGKIELTPCVFKTKSGQFKAECGTMVVKESFNKPDSRFITLPVIRVHSVNTNPREPIFYLAGGPGQSNMSFKPPDELLADHDFVLLGYRGVDGSVRLDCPEVSKAIKGTGRDLLSGQSLSGLSQAFSRCAERLQAEGVDLNAYTIIDVIRDLETARTALKYDKIDLLSQSYGTRIAQIYAYQHPEIIYRSAMIGVNPPGRFVWEPDTVDHQIEYYSELCALDPECKASTPDLARTIASVAHNMPTRWLFFPIDPGKVKVITFALLYHRKTAALVFDTYLAAEKGDPGGLALMTLAYNFMFPSMITWGDLASKALSADFDRNRDYADEMDPPESIIGSPFSKLLWSLGDWPTALIPEEFRKVQISNVQTLLISGNIDFATPAMYAAKELLPALPEGKQVILSEMGHTGDIWGLQPEATVHLLTSFYDEGLADDSMFKYAPMDFTVSWGFPLIAKIAVAVFFLVILGIILLLRFIIRRIHRRFSV